MHADPTDGYNPHKPNELGYYVGNNHNADFGEVNDNPEAAPSTDRDGDAE